MRRLFTALGFVAILVFSAGRLHAQATHANHKEPTFEDRPLSAWILDLKAPAPQSRNAAAYAISGMGAEGAPAVPALIEALKDPSAAVRFAVTVALREIGPPAKAAVPALEEATNDMNDDVAHQATKALKAIRGETAAANQ